MDADAIRTLLHEALPDAPIDSAPTVDLHATLIVQRDDVLKVLQALRDRPELGCVLLVELTAVDHWPREPRYEVIYLLVSIAHRFRVRVKVRLAGDDAHVPTASGLFPAANWLEREVWDLFGIVFDAHPDPRRLLMPEDWDGYPLRKDYPVQIRKHTETSQPMQVTEEEFRANLEKDRLARH
jgi:NADH-quinone oxidoreductase subunit C